MTTYLLAGGGTAGHVNPLLAVADRIREREPQAEIIVLGTQEGLESRLVPERGYELQTIAKVPFPRRPNKAAVQFPAKFNGAVKQTRELIRSRGVDAVIGFGGYAATPAYVAAAKEGVPYVVHEANAKPGLANVLGARKAAGVGVVFPGTKLRSSEVVGMPLRAELTSLDRASSRDEAAKHFGLDPGKPVLLVFGGSLGARKLNEVFADVWPEVVDEGWQILHAIGGNNVEDVDATPAPGRVVVPYIDRMDLAYALADLVVCRSGSATVSELSALGIPAVYVPYAVGNGEQRLNAEGVVSAGGARLVSDGELSRETVREQVLPLLRDRDERERMAQRAASTGTLAGSDNVIAMVDKALTATSR